MKSFELASAPANCAVAYSNLEQGFLPSRAWLPTEIAPTNVARAKILIVAREEIILLLKGIFDLHGFHTMTAMSLAVAEPITREERPDAVVLDESVQARAGIDSARSALGRLSQYCPILVLETDLQVFADRDIVACDRIETVARPWAPEELIFRVALLLRGRPEPAREALSYADVTIDLRRHVIYRNRRRVNVTPIEFHLLQHLMRYPRRVFTRGELHKAAWPQNVFVELRTIDVHVGKLRRALCSSGESNLIRTVRSCGYALDAET